MLPRAITTTMPPSDRLQGRHLPPQRTRFHLPLPTFERPSLDRYGLTTLQKFLVAGTGSDAVLTRSSMKSSIHFGHGLLPIYIKIKTTKLVRFSITYAYLVLFLLLKTNSSHVFLHQNGVWGIIIHKVFLLRRSSRTSHSLQAVCTLGSHLGQPALSGARARL